MQQVESGRALVARRRGALWFGTTVFKNLICSDSRFDSSTNSQDRRTEQEYCPFDHHGFNPGFGAPRALLRCMR